MTDEMKEALKQLHVAVGDIHKGIETLMGVENLDEAKLAIRELIAAIGELHAFATAAIAPHVEDKDA